MTRLLAYLCRVLKILVDIRREQEATERIGRIRAELMRK